MGCPAALLALLMASLCLRISAAPRGQHPGLVGGVGAQQAALAEQRDGQLVVSRLR